MAIINGSDSDERLFGTDQDDTIRGFGGSDFLVGFDGNDLLDGGAGADLMVGGNGHDDYVVDNTGDVIAEGTGGGFDTVRTSVSYALGANVERLLLSGGPAINGTGNELDNDIVGNNADNELSGLDGNDTLRGRGGNDVLIGGLGTDTMQGDEGNDIYNVDNAGDVVIEFDGQGYDTVRSTVSYTLSANVERLLLTGGPAIDGTGNELDNMIVGNDAANTLSGLAGNDTLRGRDGNDVLNGGLGADTMQGDEGHDSYTVDNVGDVVIEAANQGFDTVRSSISYTLTDNVERLLLTGGPSTDGTGNNLDNEIVGNNAANVLNGLDGDDSLRGRNGADTLNGGLGSDILEGGLHGDRFVFNTTLGPANIDTMTDFEIALDIIELDAAIFAGLSLGTLDADAFNNGGPLDATDRIVYDTTSGALYFDPDGDGATAATQFATVGNLAAVSNTDFLVV
jgi:Ca2+-binding RTX toxin-like protein